MLATPCDLLLLSRHHAPERKAACAWYIL